MTKTTKLLVAVGVFAGFAACTRSGAPTPPKENIFRFGLEAKVPSLDPHYGNDVYSSLAEALVYEPLYHYHYLKRPLEVVPLLAEKLPEFSKDRKKLTIELKKGVHFQADPCFGSDGKGREVTAADVVYMFERIGSPKKISTAYGEFEDTIVGFKDFHTGKARTIEGVQQLDPHKIEIRLTRPMPRFAYALVNIHTAIVPKECVEKYGDQFATHPVGTGAYRITQADLNYKIVAQKNLGYKHMAYPTDGNPGDPEKGLLNDAGKALPFIDKVVLEVASETQPRWLKFLNGESEMVGIPKEQIGTVIVGDQLAPDLAKRGIQRIKQLRSDVTVEAFNMEDPLWGKKKELRQAFALALDIPQIIQMQYAGQAIRAHSVLDPTQYGYEESFKSRWATRDVAKAKQLLAKAGYPDGKGLPPVSYISMSSTITRQLNELIQRQLAEAGIQLQVDYMTWPELTKRWRTKNYTVSGLGFASSVPDVEDATGLLKSASIAPGPNLANYKNPSVDKLIKEIEELDNGPARMERIRRLKVIIDDELPYIPMTHRVANQLSQPWLKNHVFMEMQHLGFFLKYHKVQVANDAGKK